MMATAEPPNSSSFLPLLESLEDSAAGQSEHTDAYLTIASRFSGEDGRQFLPAVEKHFPRLGKVIMTHILSPNAELCQAALQVLGFCVYHSRVGSGVPETFAAEVLSQLCSLVVKSTDKNTCTRALWVISKQSFPPDVVAKKVSSILEMLQSVWSREDIQSVVMEHEALNVVIRLLEQAPSQMGDGAVRWAKLVIPLVVHSASKVRLRAAAAVEMGMPLLLAKQMEVAAVIEPMMCSKLIPELQKLFMSKNETNVLKLWPLFVKLLGKLLHRGGPFINSLLHLEELGFRSSSATIKKIAFIAWKSLIDNFALNPDILCSSKRMKLLLQPLASIHVRTEALLLTKVEVWWYLVVQLGPNLSANFDQVSVPLLQCTIGSDVSSVSGTPSRAVGQNGAVAPGTPKTATSGLNSPANMSRLSLNCSIQIPTTYPSIQLLGLEMLLHYFVGPEVIATAAKNKLILSLEPLNHSLLSGTSNFTKHAAVLTSNIRDGFINIGKDAPDALLAIIWTSLVRFVNLTIESGGGSKKDRQGCEGLTQMLQALQSIVSSEALPANKVLILFEATVKGIPQRVLGSASYQVGKMDVLNGTPALFLILLLYNSSLLAAYIEDERFFQCLQTLVGCGLSGPTSPLAFGEAVLGAIGRSAGSVQNKEQLWRMWSVMVGPLTDTITQSNEVNQGDALEHNFSAIYSALLFPITHLLHGTPLQQATHKSMLSTWSKLYKVFARCSALVVTAEENICCEELCAKMTTAIDSDALKVPSTLNAVASILQVMVGCVDFSPYTPQFQQKLKSPHTPVNWMKKRNKVLGNLSTFQSLLVQCLGVYLEAPETSSEGTGLALISVLSALFSNITLANTVNEALTSVSQPLALFYKHASCEPPTFTPQLLGKLEKLLGEVFGCLQTCSALAYDDELLTLLSPLLCVVFPHKNKQLRSSVTQFWNSTFANSVSLTYPNEIRPILSQVKQKTPIILPGFEAVSVPDDLSGQYSSESSQLETKLSGMPVSSVGKRDSLVGKAPELKDKSSTKTSKTVSTKLDLGSPKPPRREVLEEEASIDFVFIPPETKERVLTEHQKEVKRTKRVDIPAMYNNLDASLDTTVFTQYTQSQEDSLDKLPTEQAEKGNVEPPGKVPPQDVANKEDNEVETKETQDYASPSASGSITENHELEEMIPESADVSVVEDANSDGGVQSKEDVSPNSSGTSDLISGTPQKSNSRRQSFITLEKYSEGKPASPSSVSTFTGPLIKTSNSQEHSNCNKTPSTQASVTTALNSEESKTTGKLNSQHAVNDAPESPLRPRDCGRTCEPVKLTERMPSDVTDDDDVIPDTQTGAEGKRSTTMASTLEELQPSSQEDESELSQSSITQTSPGEPRRSGRHRIRPLLPGEDADECEEKFSLKKRRRSDEEPMKDSPKSSSMQSRPSTRSRQAAEEDSSTDRLRPRAQRDGREARLTDSQGRAHKKVKLYSNSQTFLDNPEPRRRSARGESGRTDSQSDTQSDHDSQSQGRRGRRSKSALDSTEEVGRKKQVLPDKEESSQAVSHELIEPTVNENKPKNDSQIVPSPSAQSQDSELTETKRVTRDSQVVASSPTVEASCDRTSPANTQVNKSAVKDQHNTRTDRDDNLSQEDSQVVTSSASESQSLRRSRRSKASSEAAESEDTSENKDSSRRQSKSNSQATPPVVNDAEATIGGRIRKSRVQEGQSKESPLSTPESSQSLNMGSTESSQGRGRYSRRRSSQALVASVESSESESSEARENLPLPKKRGRKPRVSLPSPLTVEIKELTINADIREDHRDTLQSQKAGAQTENTTDLEDSQKTQELECVEMQQSHIDPPTDGAAQESDTGEKSKSPTVSPHKEKQRQQDSKMTINDTSSQKSAELQSTEMHELVELSTKNTEENIHRDPSLSAVSAVAPPVETPEELQAADGSEETREEELQPADGSEETREEELQAADGSEETTEEELQAADRSEETREEELQAADGSEETRKETTEEELQAADRSEETREEELPAQDGSEETREEELQAADRSEETREEELQAADRSEETREEELQAADGSEETRKETTEELPAADRSEETTEEELPAADGSEETTEEELPAADGSEEKAKEVSEPGDNVKEKQSDESDSNQKEYPLVSGEDTSEGSHSSSTGPNLVAGPNVTDNPSKEDEQQCSIKGENPTNQHTEPRAQSNSDITPLQDGDEDIKTQNMECQAEQQTETISPESHVTSLDEAQPHICSASVVPESTSNVFQGSPVKQRDLETVMGADVGQSPSSGRTRGTWSPSASPSTSILKKGQKRPLEDETPSPLVKSRHVSFADPIQHQELADDIDRRSPAIRTSSPRRPKITNIPQPKYVTTPTKGLLILSPRNLHSPGYKSSKKCLISEMSQEPRPVSRDCIYPALVGCSTPVEAVLPQISSNMWSRGFGQLVRARNIKTVGDLSALTPSEIKTLPIRSPKISNVKRALKSYEQQRKGRGGDELKSFDETEMMISGPQNQDEDDKTSGETLATELMDESVPAEAKPEQGDALTPEQRGEGAARVEGLVSEVEALSGRMTASELSGCSAQQLVHMHHQFSGLMRSVMLELHSRLSHTHGQP